MATTQAASGNNKTNAILAWVFAPITSLIWMKDADAYLQHHAKQSLAWGIVSVIMWVVLVPIISIFTFGIGAACIIPIASILDIAVRLIGLIKANNGEKWVVPVVGGMIK